MTTIAIVQSSYIPWKGYFDLIRRADRFVLYDCVQYTSRDWRNRNRIKTAHGLRWLTIPMRHAPRNEPISRMQATGSDWQERHWKTIRHAYAKAPYFALYAPKMEQLYQTVPGPALSAINQHFVSGLAGIMDIRTPLHLLRNPLTSEGDATDKLVAVCRHYGADRYLSGPSAKAYLNGAKFRQAGIDLEWMDYGRYPEYQQGFPPFEHGVSILDLLFHTGYGWDACL